MLASDSQPYPSRYVMLEDNQGNLRPSPYPQHNIPLYHSVHKSSNRKHCFRCICYCYSFLFFTTFALVASVLLLYSIYKPMAPTYEIEKFEVRAFDIKHDFSFYSEFMVTVKATNPNDNISLIYDEGSYVVVTYLGSQLCSGKIPAFEQHNKNVSTLNVLLKGKSELGSSLRESLIESQDNGIIPMHVMVTAPVSAVMGTTRLRDIVVRMDCYLVVNNLSPNKKIEILSRNYHVDFSLE